MALWVYAIVPDTLKSRYQTGVCVSEPHTRPPLFHVDCVKITIPFPLPSPLPLPPLPSPPLPSPPLPSPTSAPDGRYKGARSVFRESPLSFTSNPLVSQSSILYTSPLLLSPTSAPDGRFKGARSVFRELVSFTSIPPVSLKPLYPTLLPPSLPPSLLPPLPLRCGQRVPQLYSEVSPPIMLRAFPANGVSW